MPVDRGEGPVPARLGRRRALVGLAGLVAAAPARARRDEPASGPGDASEPLDAFGRGPDARSTDIPPAAASRRGSPRRSTTAPAAATRCTFGADRGRGPRPARPARRAATSPTSTRASSSRRSRSPTTARSSCSAAASSPGKGWWAQPGGFLEVDETVTEAAIRETLEETGLIVEPGEIVGLYSRLEAAVVVHRVRGAGRRRRVPR